MEKPSDIKLESVYTEWCEAVESPSGHGVLPFEAFKEGFRQGVLFGETFIPEVDLCDDCRRKAINALAEILETRGDGGFPTSGTWFGEKEE